jgi:hypothetical protein
MVSVCSTRGASDSIGVGVDLPRAPGICSDGGVGSTGRSRKEIRLVGTRPLVGTVILEYSDYGLKVDVQALVIR